MPTAWIRLKAREGFGSDLLFWPFARGSSLSDSQAESLAFHGLARGPLASGIVFSLSLFASVLIHELAHVWVALRRGRFIRLAALADLASAPHSTLPVMAHGKVIGILRYTDLTEVLQLRSLEKSAA